MPHPAQEVVSLLDAAIAGLCFCPFNLNAMSMYGSEARYWF